MARFFAGDIDGAVRDAEEALILDPSSRSSQMTAMTIRLCAQMGPDRTRKFMGPILRLPPRILLVYYQGMEALVGGEHDKAVKSYDRALQLLRESSDDPAVRAAPYVQDMLEVTLLMLLPGTANGKSPEERNKVRERVDALYEGLRARRPGWITPVFGKAMAHQAP